MPVCHMCGEVTEFYCEDCDEPVCEKCAVPYTPQNNCEGTHCSDCCDTSQMLMAEEYQREEEYERHKDEKRKKRKEVAWQRYHSSEQWEKRMLAKIELAKQRREHALKRREEIGNILKGFGF